LFFRKFPVILNGVDQLSEGILSMLQRFANAALTSLPSMEIAEELEAALEQFAAIAEDLKR